MIALYLLTALHVIVCVFLIISVLLQSGKAADLAGAFGGMGSQTAFGPRGSATLLSKATTISAILFMLTSLSLSILATRGTGGSGSVLEGQTQQQPAAPAPAGQTAPAAPAGQQSTAPFTIQTEPAKPGAQPVAPAQPAPAQK
jgi:preprotein translocase subunit SecG